MITLLPEDPPRSFDHCCLCGVRLVSPCFVVRCDGSRVGYACAGCKAADPAELRRRLHVFAVELDAAADLRRRLALRLTGGRTGDGPTLPTIH
jgi:hypothetical protein